MTVAGSEFTETQSEWLMVTNGSHLAQSREIRPTPGWDNAELIAVRN